MKIYKLIKTYFSSLRNKSIKRNIVEENQINQLIYNEIELNIFVRTIKATSQKFSTFFMKSNFDVQTGFRILYSNGFNSIGFKEPVDLVFCDKFNHVIDTYSNFNPQSFTKYNDKVRYIYVLYKNLIKNIKIKKNDILDIK